MTNFRLLALGLFLFPGFAFGTELNCVSYSKKFDLRILVDESSAEVKVGKSTDRGSYGLTSGEEISLSRGVETSREWARFEGRSERNQDLTLNLRKADLAGRRPFRASLLISADWTDTTEVSNELLCESTR